MKNKKLYGFTTLELVIAISIMLILTSLVFLNISMISLNKEKNEINQLVKQIEYTRNNSITMKKRQSINFNSNNSYKSSVDDELYQFESVNMRKDKSNTESFSFTPNGTPSKGGSGTIYFEGKEKIYRISVTPVTGKVNLYEEEK